MAEYLAAGFELGEPAVVVATPEHWDQFAQRLASRGYYYGPIDGILGPDTRNAIQRYQINRGLAVTAAIDEPTLATLGLA